MFERLIDMDCLINATLVKHGPIRTGTSSHLPFIRCQFTLTGVPKPIVVIGYGPHCVDQLKNMPLGTVCNFTGVGTVGSKDAKWIFVMKDCFVIQSKTSS